MNKATQKQKIWQALKQGKTLDWLAAFKLCGTSKLSTRIGELEKERGVKVNRGWKKPGKVRTYWL